LNPPGEGAEIAHALEFVVGEFDLEMLFDVGQKVESLEAIDAELLEEIVVGTELIVLDLEMLG
jgi:hypothetical protein